MGQALWYEEEKTIKKTLGSSRVRCYSHHWSEASSAESRLRGVGEVQSELKQSRDLFKKGQSTSVQVV